MRCVSLRNTRSPANSRHLPLPLPLRPKSVQTPHVRFVRTGCGGPLVGRQRVACSSRCRAVVSRQRTVEARRQRDAEIRGLLEAVLEKLQEGAP